MNQQLWTESFGPLLKQRLICEAKYRHVMFQPPLTLEAWQAQREQLRSQVFAQIGKLAEPCSLDMQEHRMIDMPTYAIRMITYQSRPGLRVTANLFTPKGKGPFPGLLVVHGHWANGKASPEVQSRCHMFASEGFVVLAVDAFGSGERGTVPGEFEYHGAQIGASLLNIGQTLLGLQLNDNMRGIDLLQSLDYVDADRIGVTGASGGGNQTMWTAALDERVKAAVPVVSVGTFEIYITSPNCVCEMLPDGLTFTEEWGILGLIAPRPLLILNSLQDPPFFSVHEMIRSYTGAREVYKLHGVIDRIAYQGIDLPHGYQPEMQRFALGWFRRWLQGIGEGRACDVNIIPALPYQDLLVFPDAQRPAEVQSIYQFSAPIAQQLAASHMEETAPLDRDNKACELATLLRLPADIHRMATESRTLTADGIDTKAFLLEIPHGIPLPVEVYCKSGIKPEKATVIVHHLGRRSIRHESWMQQLLEAGYALVLPDLSHTGALAWDERDEGPLPPFHEASRSTIWLGRTMIGEWVRDILAINRYLRTALAMKRIDLIGYRDAGIAVLCAAVISNEFTTITTCNTLATYVPTSQFFKESMAVHVPGILQWGDVSMMAVLARAQVRMHNPVRTDGLQYNVDEIAALERDLSRLSERLAAPLRVNVSTGSLEGHQLT